MIYLVGRLSFLGESFACLKVGSSLRGNISKADYDRIDIY